MSRRAALPSSPTAGAAPADAAPRPLHRRAGDPVERLYKQGLLMAEHVRAANEIRAAFAIVSGPVGLRVSKLTGMPRERPGARLPFDDETARRLTLVRCYRRWLAALKQDRLPAWPAFDIVIEELSCRAADAKRGVRNGSAKKGLVLALDRYAHERGWLGWVGTGRKTVSVE